VCTFVGENGDNSDQIKNDSSNIALHISNTLLQNSPSVQRVLQQCRGVDGSYNMCCVLECLVKSPAIRDCLRQINCQGTINFIAVHNVQILLYSSWLYRSVIQWRSGQVIYSNGQCFGCTFANVGYSLW